MKRAIIVLVGLPRTYLQTYQNFFECFIEPNKTEFNIDIVFHTTTNRETEIDLITKYNKYNQVKNFINKEINFNGLNNAYYERTIFRIKDTIESLKDFFQYNLYIFYRMDQTINSIVKFNLYFNKLSIICPNFTRPSLFHNRDWTHCFIGEKIPLILFLHSYSIFYQEVCNYDKINMNCIIDKYIDESIWKIYNSEIENKTIENEEIERINKSVGLINIYTLNIDDFKRLNWESLHKHSTYLYLFKGIKNIMNNGYVFELGDSKNIYVNIVR
jgi:hypothetical protein